VRENVAAREALLDRLGSLAPWAVAAGMGVAALGYPPVGIGLLVAGVGILPAYELLSQKKIVETLDRWEPQLEHFREAHKGAQQAREWSLQGSGGGVVEGERSVQIGGVVVRLRPAA
jgi:hypothetical protein